MKLKTNNWYLRELLSASFSYLLVKCVGRHYLQSFQRELSKRTSNMSSIRVAARQLLDQSSATSQADESRVQGRLVDLTTKWDTVCRLSVRKQERLHDARCLVHALLMLLICYHYHCCCCCY